jgi:hypothetical protein
LEKANDEPHMINEFMKGPAFAVRKGISFSVTIDYSVLNQSFKIGVF